MSKYEVWQALQEERGLHLLDSSDPMGYAYFEGPYPNIDETGKPMDLPPGDGEPQNLVSWVIREYIIGPFPATHGGGDFLTGYLHESDVGDLNGNLVHEWVVWYFYLPWMSDGLDNDGDGCTDEKAYVCDAFPDAMVVYETGGYAYVGGDDGTLLVNIDYYSDFQVIELFRAFASPKWNAFRMRGMFFSPQMAGEFISYESREFYNNVNANALMDNDQNDWYVGNIDARGFPSRPPINHVCSAGRQFYMGVTFQRDDGWVVTSYELWESFDDMDWNGDGDKADFVAAYYVVNPLTGECNRGVNGGVSGVNPTNSGIVLTPGYTWESTDGRDWNGDEDLSDTVTLWHNINSTWSLKGRIYASYTFIPLLIERQKFGFGFWGRTPGYLYGDSSAWPLKFGGAYWNYGPQYYTTSFWLTADEDGNPQTVLPSYYINYGQPAGTLGGVCVHVFAREYYLEYANVDLIGSIADGNGDGDIYDTLSYIFCPDKSGGGGDYVVEGSSKYAEGWYNEPIPFIWSGDVYIQTYPTFEGRTLIPFYDSEWEWNVDCDGDIGSSVCYAFYPVNVSIYGKSVPGGELTQGAISPGVEVLKVVDRPSYGPSARPEFGPELWIRS